MNKRSLIESGLVVIFATTMIVVSFINGSAQERVMYGAELSAYCDELEQANDQLTTQCNNLTTEVETYDKVLQEQIVEYNTNLSIVYGQLLDYYSPTGTVAYTDDDIILLAKVMQTEAGSNNFVAQAAIAQVILNRVNSEKFPDTIHDVVYQNDGAIQFAVAYDGSLDKCELNVHVLINAMRVLSTDTIYPDNLLYFCADPINFDSYATFYAEIEGTKFYTR